jgi:hypothetical protein
MVDCYYPKEGKLPDDVFPSESFPIKAGSDDEAIKEAAVHAAWKKAAYYRVRIGSRRHVDDQIIFRSPKP